jgi:hypothetical protein
VALLVWLALHQLSYKAVRYLRKLAAAVRVLCAIRGIPWVVVQAAQAARALMVTGCLAHRHQLSQTTFSAAAFALPLHLAAQAGSRRVPSRAVVAAVVEAFR